MLKKAGIVTAAAVALSLVAAPAFAATAAPQDTPTASPANYGQHHDGGDFVSFGDAYRTFIWGGGALGAGAAALVAGAYTGIATTPSEILHSLEHHGH
ncbi:MAG TPA: hypothetical protein VFW65_11720 [Pseudonocardiaceae bacterium]|nr:hypothetical protein [Pseudonocardiaceae bacterium]